jgi:hypothetical protein
LLNNLLAPPGVSEPESFPMPRTRGGLSMMIESPDQQSLDDFAALYVGHYEQLLRLAVLLVGDMAAAEDVVQEAFIRVHRAVESRSPHNPLAYLRQAVVNLARSELRRRLVRLRHAPRPMPDAASAEEGACAAISRSTRAAAPSSGRSSGWSTGRSGRSSWPAIRPGSRSAAPS